MRNEKPFLRIFAISGMTIMATLVVLILNNFITNKSLAHFEKYEYNPLAVDEQIETAELGFLEINMHGVNSTKGTSSLSSLNHCKSLVYRTLKSLPETSVKKLKTLTLTFDPTARRGMGGGETIILRCVGISDAELVSVLVHEMGHITDTGVMSGKPSAGSSRYMDGGSPVFRDDPSIGFYSVSWNNETQIKDGFSGVDFVSGYAMTDAFEDFAESYNYYILHGIEFRKLTKTNMALAKKYDFLKEKVFQGREYENGYETNVKAAERKYDTTVLAYSMNKFFRKIEE